jgi:hypothetical protein
MTAPYLTDAEIADITAPLIQGAARIKFFREVVKCRVEAKPNGQPLVWRSDFDAARRPLTGAANDAAEAVQGANAAALRDRLRYGRGQKA